VQTTPASVISLTRGDTFVTHADIGVGRTQSNAVTPSLTTAAPTTTGCQVDASGSSESSKRPNGCADYETSTSDMTQSFF
jgi:hypothetical protein